MDKGRGEVGRDGFEPLACGGRQGLGRPVVPEAAGGEDGHPCSVVHTGIPASRRHVDRDVANPEGSRFRSAHHLLLQGWEASLVSAGVVVVDAILR